jgi:hypothetical protein
LSSIFPRLTAVVLPGGMGGPIDCCTVAVLHRQLHSEVYPEILHTHTTQLLGRDTTGTVLDAWTLSFSLLLVGWVSSVEPRDDRRLLFITIVNCLEFMRNVISVSRQYGS